MPQWLNVVQSYETAGAQLARDQRYRAAVKRKALSLLAKSAAVPIPLPQSRDLLRPRGRSQRAAVCVEVPFLDDNSTLRFLSPNRKC